jgi:hypothetical protein
LGSSQASRPLLTTETNLILLQKQLKRLVKGNFEFRNTRNGTRIIAKERHGFSSDARSVFQRAVELFGELIHEKLYLAFGEFEEGQRKVHIELFQL